MLMKDRFRNIGFVSSAFRRFIDNLMFVKIGISDSLRSAVSTLLALDICKQFIAEMLHCSIETIRTQLCTAVVQHSSSIGLLRVTFIIYILNRQGPQPFSPSIITDIFIISVFFGVRVCQ